MIEIVPAIDLVSISYLCVCIYIILTYKNNFIVYTNSNISNYFVKTQIITSLAIFTIGNLIRNSPKTFQKTF